MTPILRTAIALVALCIAALGANAQRSFTVGTVTAAPGQKATGFIDVPAGVDAALQIPVVVVNGAKPGPVLSIVAGSHGTEYATIIAVERLIHELDPAEISGTVILVPLVNVNSFLQKVPHLNPVDGKNMNRMFPGKPDGTQTDRASWLITKDVVEQSDYLIDMHGGDLDENLRPYSYWPQTGNPKLDSVTREMVLAFGLDNIIIFDDRPTDPNNSRYLDNTAITRGKPAIIVEAGYAGNVDTDDVNRIVRGCIGVMRDRKILPGDVTPVENPVWYAQVVTLTSEQNGIFYPVVKRGTYVQQGMRIGYVTDFFGNRLEDVRATVSGVVLFICAVPSMKKGDNLIDIGVVAAKAP